MIQLDLQPRLAGELIELRPMRPEDWRDLYAVAADPLIWEVHPARDRYKEERFREYFEEALQSCGALVAVDRKTGGLSALPGITCTDRPKPNSRSAGPFWLVLTGAEFTMAR